MTDTASSPAAILPAVSRHEERFGYLLVFLSALMWSFGGTIARFIDSADSWTVVFWRSVWAAAFLICFMAWRDGWRGTLKLFRGMGLPGLAVALCFATASTAFVVALAYTTVANILLMQAGVPLLAALFAWALFREQVAAATWVAIAAVIAGVAIMVSESLDGTVSPVGDGLALLIAVVFATATVITRRFSHVRMTPATASAPSSRRRSRCSRHPRSTFPSATWVFSLPSAWSISALASPSSPQAPAWFRRPSPPWSATSR